MAGASSVRWCCCGWGGSARARSEGEEERHTMMTLHGRRVLVTGGAGFVGAALVKRLMREGAHVTVLDDLFTGRRKNLPATGLEFIEGSVCDAPLVERVVPEHEVILHAAARNIVVSTRNPREDFQTNIGGTLNLLLAARGSNVRRIVYTSSASVYGNPRTLPLNEDDPLSLLTPYAVSKLAGEHYCMAFYESYGLPVAAVRYSNIYGPGQDPANPYCGVVAKFVEALFAGRPPVIHGDGSQTRDFTYIDDAVEATLLAASAERALGEVFNVGTGVETSVNQLAALLVRTTGVPIEPAHTDRRDVDNIRRRVVNIEKTRRALRWVPEVTLEEGLRRTVEWQRSEARSASTAQTA
ncbi:MAG: NAD-dependent epimerase/dehydratase family protein [Candidatus Eisenbacteria bacterium]|uniref:NAD-dependent epimerase/dehydratase family protein n=1 Tax=Eiseniibacteriota bacterium TaxID=2212470 RepID=A0A538TY38_UNCEI|nr:MAG: NAD-dependent epimerase/dehydratase family protein [Candidatus Eisenbacteria bacterium]